MCGVASSLPWPPPNPAKPSETSHSASKRWGGIFDLPGLRHEVERLDSVTAEPGFWDDNEKAQKTLRDRAATQAKIDKFQKLSEEIKELGELIDLAVSESDEDMLAEVAAQLPALSQGVRQMEVARMLGGPEDGRYSIVTTHPGPGGGDAQC